MKKQPWFDDDAEVAKLTGVNRSTGELVPFSYESPDWRLLWPAVGIAVFVVILLFY